MSKRKSGKDINIKFLPEDAGWMTLQQRVIETAGKPIEDLKCHDLAPLYAVLSESERKAVRDYRSRTMAERFAPLISHAEEGNDEDWEERVCRRTWSWLLEDFWDLVRPVIVRFCQIYYEKNADKYADLVADFKKQLCKLIDRYPGLSWTESDWDDFTFVGTNVARIPPTDEGMALIKSILERLKARDAELKKSATKKETEDRKQAASTIMASVLTKADARKQELANKPWGLWDVVFKNRPIYKDVIIRVRARDEDEAADTANDLFCATIETRPPDRKRRKVYRPPSS